MVSNFTNFLDIMKFANMDRNSIDRDWISVCSFYTIFLIYIGTRVCIQFMTVTEMKFHYFCVILNVPNISGGIIVKLIAL